MKHKKFRGRGRFKNSCEFKLRGSTILAIVTTCNVLNIAGMNVDGGACGLNTQVASWPWGANSQNSQFLIEGSSDACSIKPRHCTDMYFGLNGDHLALKPLGTLGPSALELWHFFPVPDYCEQPLTVNSGSMVGGEQSFFGIHHVAHSYCNNDMHPKPGSQTSAVCQEGGSWSETALDCVDDSACRDFERVPNKVMKHITKEFVNVAMDKEECAQICLRTSGCETIEFHLDGGNHLCKISMATLSDLGYFEENSGSPERKVYRAL